MSINSVACSPKGEYVGGVSATPPVGGLSEGDEESGSVTSAALEPFVPPEGAYIPDSLTELFGLAFGQSVTQQNIVQITDERDPDIDISTMTPEEQLLAYKNIVGINYQTFFDGFSPDLTIRHVMDGFNDPNSPYPNDELIDSNIEIFFLVYDTRTSEASPTVLFGSLFAFQRLMTLHPEALQLIGISLDGDENREGMAAFSVLRPIQGKKEHLKRGRTLPGVTTVNIIFTEEKMFLRKEYSDGQKADRVFRVVADEETGLNYLFEEPAPSQSDLWQGSTLVSALTSSPMSKNSKRYQIPRSLTRRRKTPANRLRSSLQKSKARY